VYLLLSEKKGTYYIGATTDPTRRLEQHNTGKGGFHTRSFGPWVLLHVIRCAGHSEALKLELKMKKLPPGKKLQAFQEHNATSGDVSKYGHTRSTLTGGDPQET
jgi:putative endonuclease